MYICMYMYIVVLGKDRRAYIHLTKIFRSLHSGVSTEMGELPLFSGMETVSEGPVQYMGGGGGGGGGRGEEGEGRGGGGRGGQMKRRRKKKGERGGEGRRKLKTQCLMACPLSPSASPGLSEAGVHEPSVRNSMMVLEEGHCWHISMNSLQQVGDRHTQCTTCIIEQTGTSLQLIR